MNATTNFELLSTGSEFETASEEFERGFAHRGGAARRGPLRRPPRRRPPPGRPAPRPLWPYGHGGALPWGSAAPWPPTQYQRCMQDCLQSRASSPSAFGSRTAEPEPEPEPEPGADSTAADGSSDASADGASPDQEMTMRKTRCNCPKCNPGTAAFEVMEFESPAMADRNGFGNHEAESYEAEEEGEEEGEFGQYEGPYQSAAEGEAHAESEFEDEYKGEAQWAGEGGAEGPFSEAEEIALAAELMSVSNEAELEQFLGSLWKGIRKVGSAVGKAAQPFSGVLKGLAKKALPFVGGALGSLIPIPGVGTALGSALGGALSQALEMEFGAMELEDREFEMARRFVRIAGTAAQQLGQAVPGGNPQAAIESAIADAAQQHLLHFKPRAGWAGPRMSGRWTRHGNTLVLTGA